MTLTTRQINQALEAHVLPASYPAPAALAAIPYAELNFGGWYLPGGLEEKLNPWMQPIYDNLKLLTDSFYDDEDKLQYLLDSKVLEMEARDTDDAVALLPREQQRVLVSHYCDTRGLQDRLRRLGIGHAADETEGGAVPAEAFGEAVLVHAVGVADHLEAFAVGLQQQRRGAARCGSR